MALKYLTDIDLNQNELQNAVLQNVSGSPSSTEPGQIWYDSDANAIKVNLNNSIKALLAQAFTSAALVTGTSDWTPSSIISGQYELLFKAGNNVTITKVSDQISGEEAYQISATNTTYSAGTDDLLTAGTDTTNRVWQAKILHDYIATVVGAVDAMRFKGTLGTGGTITTLPTTGVRVGDTYMVTTAGTYAGQVCEVGDLIIATATTPSWTVAQTNINGALTNVESGTGISVTGSGNSRTVSLASGVATAGSKGDTSNQTPGFGGTFKVTSETIDTYGRTTALAEHTVTIPNATATSSVAGLMSAQNYTDLSELAQKAPKMYQEINPAMTPSGGVCTWTVTHNLGNTYAFPFVQIYDMDTKAMVMADVTVVSGNVLTIKILSTTAISSGKYIVTVACA